MNQHSSRCILRNLCQKADTSACNRLCPHYLAVHGYSGEGGRNGRASLSIDYRFITLKDSPCRTDQPAAYKLIDAYAATFSRIESGERIKSLYLYSESPGTGKTTTAAALLNAWSAMEYLARLKKGGGSSGSKAPYFLDVNAWQTQYNAFNRPRVPESIAAPASELYYNSLIAAQDAPFAVLDDIGVRDASEAFRADLHTVINARVTNGLPTVYTSNIPMAALAAVFDARLADRIRDMCAEVRFVGGSRRGMR